MKAENVEAIKRPLRVILFQTWAFESSQSPTASGT